MGTTSRLAGIVLAAALSGVAEPAALLAQQTPDATQGATPSTTAPAAQPESQNQAPEQTTPESKDVERQQQEDKAAQDLINGTRESGTQLPESPDSTRAREEAARKATEQQNPSGQPTGTAAAPAGTVSGSVASRPAGAAIAPAKQRQVRSFLIKLGVVAGAGIALGTVYALSRGSSSTPPGAR
jgi:hypothetical protein